jgi:regulator of protease activity HflC (stomatin/prohibitin superfamily)
MLERLLEVHAALGREDQSAALRARQRDIEQALSAPFDSEIPQLEFITTDLKRIRTQDCGAISFKVDDARTLLSNFSSIEDVKRLTGLMTAAALRKIVGSRSSSQVFGEPERIAGELTDALDRESKPFGCSVRALPTNLATCLR